MLSWYAVSISIFQSPVVLRNSMGVIGRRASLSRSFYLGNMCKAGGCSPAATAVHHHNTSFPLDPELWQKHHDVPTDCSVASWTSRHSRRGSSRTFQIYRKWPVTIKRRMACSSAILSLLNLTHC